MLKLFLLNFKKDLRNHFSRRGARPFIMSALCVLYASLLAAQKAFSASGRLSGFFADVMSYAGAEWLYSAGAALILALSAPFCLDPGVRKELAFLEQMKANGVRHRSGVLLASKYVAAFLFVWLAYSAGFAIAAFSGNLSGGVSPAVYLNTLLLLVLTAALVVSLRALGVSNGLAALLPSVFTGVIAAVTAVLGADLRAVLSSSAISGNPLLICVTLAVLLTIFTYMAIKVSRPKIAEPA